LREAVQEKRKVFVQYRDLAEQSSERILRPLGCFYWGKVWTLSAWCERRNDFRTFRVDRVVKAKALEERFRDEPGRTLADLLRMNEQQREQRAA
jgi:predicted DNA-binding transcriptional regulator YafY